MNPQKSPPEFTEQKATAQSAWEECSSFIREQISSLSFKTWFQPIVPVHLQEKELSVQVPSQFFYDWLEEHYITLIRSTLIRVLGEGATLSYIISSDDPIESFDGTINASVSAQHGVSSHNIGSSVAHPFSPYATIKTMSGITPIQSNLNPRYNFENFIKGDSNQLARAAAMAVANNPGGTSFNPLVIYGGTGLGKTHLMHAIGNYALHFSKAKRVLYVSSEKFTVEFVEAIQTDKVNNFSHFYRSVDLLIVDDIQFFTGKEKTQDNFFHTFNTLYQLGKQIVLSSDVPPKELKGLDDRLISRFQSGLTADIQPPDLETRIAILQKKSEENEIDISSEVTEYLAANVTHNIRELEGCLISLLARASLENRELNVALARDVLKMIVQEPKSPITIEKIQTHVCEYFDIPVDLLRAKTRKQEIVNARQISMYLAKELTNSSLKTIGLHFGGRDHSTVIHAYQTIYDRINTDSRFKTEVEKLSKRIELNN